MQCVGTAVTVLVPCVLWWWVWRVGSLSRSSHTRRGAAVTVDVVCVLQSWSLCPVLWWWVQRVGSRSRSLCCVYRGHGCGASGRSRGLRACGMGLWSLSMWHMCCGHGHGCGALGHGRGLCTHGMGLRSLSMWCMCRSHGLHAMCRDRGCSTSGCSCGCCHCAVCVIVVAFVLRVVSLLLSPPDPKLPWWRAWSNELREEMHRRRRSRRVPPGQVDKLPSSWTITVTAASSVRAP
jgi:hypothetical protein